MHDTENKHRINLGKKRRCKWVTNTAHHRAIDVGGEEAKGTQDSDNILKIRCTSPGNRRSHLPITAFCARLIQLTLRRSHRQRRTHRRHVEVYRGRWRAWAAAAHGGVEGQTTRVERRRAWVGGTWMAGAGVAMEDLGCGGPTAAAAPLTTRRRLLWHLGAGKGILHVANRSAMAAGAWFPSL